MTATNFTERELAILDFIAKHQADQGYPPTVRQIGDAVGLRSTSTTHQYLIRLQRKGALWKEPGKQRALRVLRP